MTCEMRNLTTIPSCSIVLYCQRVTHPSQVVQCGSVAGRIMEDVFEQARKGDLAYFSINTASGDLAQCIHSIDEDQRTLLHNAVTSGKAELVEYLLREGADQDVNSQDEEGWTPLHSAVSCGYERVTELLLLHGADVHRQTSAKRTPLHYAASKGHASVLRVLLKKGSAANAPDSVGFTPLHRAAAAGKLATVRILVDDASAIIDAQDRFHKTPLLVALEGRHDDVVLFLVARGANLNVTMEDGRNVWQVSEKLANTIRDILDERVDIEDLLQ